MKSSSRFVYVPTTKEVVKGRATQQGGLYDSYLKSEYTKYKIKDNNNIRIIPRPAVNGRGFHYGYDTFIHYEIGPAKGQYLCLSKMLNKPCPVCEDASEDMSISKRVIMWIIDRDNEKEGPQVMDVPFSVDKGISSVCINSRTGEVLVVDDPESGFDISFNREGTGKTQTRYLGFVVARQSTPLHDDPEQVDKWLNYVVDNPIENTLNYYEYDYIKNVYAGKVDKKETDEEPPSRVKPKETNEEPARTATQAKSKGDEPSEEPKHRQRQAQVETVQTAKPVEDDVPKRKVEVDDDVPPPRKRRPIPQD
jgi:hypothetical protein